MSAATTFYRKLTQIHPTIAALSPYVDSRSTPMRFRCEVCEHEWHNKPGQVVAQRKAGCPKCTVKRAGYEFRMIVVRVTGRAKDKVSVMTLPVGWQNTPAKELRRLVVSELDNI